jgi:MFS family permease
MMTVSITLKAKHRGGGLVSDAAAMPATWRSLFADGEYRALWVAQVVSVVGDQLARVALAVLVYHRTNSPLLTAMVYAITYLPWVVGGPLLGGLADRFPRRSVMITCDLLCAVLVALMALPGAPLGILFVLLFLVILLDSPFTAARSSLIADVLSDERYILASALGNLTFQTGLVLGFAAGGALVGTVGARQALLLDAATFLASAAIVWLGVRRRPAAAGRDGETVAGWSTRLVAGLRLVFGDPRLRALVVLAWLAAFYVVPEGLAAPYAQELGGDAGTVGLVLAAGPAGVVIGGLVLSRLVRPARRLMLMVPLAYMSCVPLMFYALRPPTPVALALLVASGLGASYQLAANAAFVQSVPAASRGQAFGLAAAGLVAGQGLSIVIAGAIAELVPASTVIAGAGALGLLAVAAVSGVGRRLTASPMPAVRQL